MAEIKNEKKILLVDLDDARRDSRVKIFQSLGYTVDVRNNHITAERLNHEGAYDLVIIALHRQPEAAAIYSDALSKINPQLPILLLTDYGVFVPSGTLSRSMASGSPLELIREVAAMLEGSTHVRELPIRP
jgi:DNA-binding NtrC family response regulator